MLFHVILLHLFFFLYSPISTIDVIYKRKFSFLNSIIHVPYSNLYSYFWFTYSFFKNSFLERIFTSLFHAFFHRSAFLRSNFKIKTRLFAIWCAGIGVYGWALIGNMGGRQLEMYIGICGGALIGNMGALAIG